jgi:hypothetical protein
MFRREHPKRREVVVSDRVVRITDNQSMTLSKTGFADFVLGRDAPFRDMDFGGFEPTFGVLAMICEDAQDRGFTG